MKTFMLVLAPIAAIQASTTIAQASSDIYGWDIKCVGSEGIQIRAAQADDDFYITRLAGKAKFKEVWADSPARYDASYKNVVFRTDPKKSPGKDAVLDITREAVGRPGYAHGTFTFNGDVQKVNCYVRYSEGEDTFMELVKQPFPTIYAPKK